MSRGIASRINSGAVGLRMARRDVNRNKVQSFLIILIIAMPVSLGAFAFTFRESRQPSAVERAQLYLGQAQVQIQKNLAPSEYNYQNPEEEYAVYFNPNNQESWSSGNLEDSGDFDPNEALSGYTWLSHRTSSVLAKTYFGQTTMQVDEVKAWDERLKGRFSDFKGRAPANQNEALLNAAALSRFGVSVGGTIKLLQPDQSFTVVGLIEDSKSSSNQSQIFLNPGSLLNGSVRIERPKFFGVGAEGTSWEKVTDLNRLGFGVLSREVILNPPSQEEIPLAVAGGTSVRKSMSEMLQVLVFLPILLMPVVILTGSAFSFGARRRVRSIAVISSLGARKSTLRFVTLANGLWLGFLGGLLGSAIGVVTSYFLSPSLSDGSKISYPSFDVPWGFLVGVVLGGAAIGGLVSVLPAVTASRVDVLSTLRGSRRDPKAKKRSGIFGLILIAIGVAGLLLSIPLWVYLEAQSTKDAIGWQAVANYAQLTIVLTLVSSLTAILGMMIGSSWLLVFARFVFKRIGTAANFATNDLVFNRKRFTAVVSSVIATSFVAAVVLTFYYTMAKPSVESYRPAGETNQLQTSFWYPGKQLDTKQDVEKYVKALGQEAKSAVSSAIGVAPVISTAVISFHRSFEAEGYKIYDSGETMLGIEGEIPYVKLDYNYLCPYMGASPDNKKITDAYTSNNRKLEKEIYSQEKYADCDRVSRAPTNFVVATPEEFRVLLGGRVDGTAEKALSQGAAVVFSRGFLTDGELQLDWYPSGLNALVLGEEFLPATKFEPPQDVNGNPIEFGKPSRSEKLPAVVSSSPNQSLNFVISPQTATRLGIEYQPMIAFVNFERALTQIERDMLEESIPVGYVLEDGPDIDLEGIAWLIALIAGLFVLASTSIALGLTQIESRADHSTLWSVGASKLFRAKAVSLQALTLSLIGTLCGSSIGLLLVWITTSMQTDFQLPVPQTLFLVIGIPLIAAVGFLVGTPKRYKFNPRLALD